MDVGEPLTFFHNWYRSPRWVIGIPTSEGNASMQVDRTIQVDGTLDGVLPDFHVSRASGQDGTETVEVSALTEGSTLIAAGHWLEREAAEGRAQVLEDLDWGPSRRALGRLHDDPDRVAGLNRRHGHDLGSQPVAAATTPGPPVLPNDGWLLAPRTASLTIGVPGGWAGFFPA
jgi:hypothetical protein